MILPLRQRHRRVFIALGLLLPVIFVAGITARKPVPAIGELPSALAVAPQTYEAVERQPGKIFTNTPVEVRLLHEGSDGHIVVGLSAAKDFIKPDLIVYWAGANEAITNSVPGNAILLGSFSTPVLALPDDAAKAEGRLVLFSLADNEIVDVSKPFSSGRNKHE